MPYIKSYTYVDNDVLTAANHASNEDGLREYVNQEIVAADIAAEVSMSYGYILCYECTFIGA